MLEQNLEDKLSKVSENISFVIGGSLYYLIPIFTEIYAITSWYNERINSIVDNGTVSYALFKEQMYDERAFLYLTASLATTFLLSMINTKEKIFYKSEKIGERIGYKLGRLISKHKKSKFN